MIDGYVYTIEEVGSVANENFKNLVILPCIFSMMKAKSLEVVFI